MSPPRQRVAKLTAELAEQVDLAGFDCGRAEYNDWLSEHALKAVAAGSSAVYLLLEQHACNDAARVIGYFAICPTLVVRDQMPKPLQRGMLRGTPGWLLAKLALATSHRADQQQQWGAHLLREALETIIASADAGGGQVIVVDADNAGLIDWYTRHGFRATGASDLRPYMKIATARAYLPGNRTTPAGWET